MKPVEIVGEVLVRRAERETAIAVSVNDVLANGAGLGEADGVGCVGQVLEKGRCAYGVFRFELWWGEERSALIELQLVWDIEFFEEPWDALALSDLEVVHNEMR